MNLITEQVVEFMKLGVYIGGGLLLIKFIFRQIKKK